LFGEHVYRFGLSDLKRLCSNRQKFFGSFFQKRTAFFPSVLLSLTRSPSIIAQTEHGLGA
jgi:hypothetical protein